MSAISVRFYSVTMPDGKTYSCAARVGRKKLAEHYGVGMNSIKLGVDIQRVPDISEYFDAERERVQKTRKYVESLPEIEI